MFKVTTRRDQRKQEGETEKKGQRPRQTEKRIQKKKGRVNDRRTEGVKETEVETAKLRL